MSTTDDYQAAFFRWSARPGELVAGDRIRPQRIDGGDRFGYRVGDGAGARFVLVEPAAGIRRPAFDHARLAAALTAASGQPVDPQSLPIRAIALAGDTVEFDAFSEYLAIAQRCGLAKGTSSYQVRLLERAGLVKVVRARKIRGVSERYYAMPRRRSCCRIRVREGRPC